MIKITKINWLDKEAKEAEVTLLDDFISINCFFSNCNLKEKSVFRNVIYGFDVDDIFQITDNSYKADKISDDWMYCIQGQLIDKYKSIVKVGEFEIDISDGFIPKDIEKGAYIKAKISRFDILRMIVNQV
ncbi:hypothetical protein [Xylocopilactobacillus apicola]|uniref:Uncharacterized protein n=1 Tax=Xylocopilactobacillus apicola TaxID=2932184 RepID=A0AAU9CZC5_9LACO|nr:hypothetical protein [Xylocopilactobacillus apicola]BDR59377.1 hypothetical protein XA3_18180 [Xylocopilactobacillus apicola]